MTVPSYHASWYPLYCLILLILSISHFSMIQWCLLWTPDYYCYVFLSWLSYDLHLWFYTLGYSVAWDIGIYMRVSLFGLFLRCTSLMGPWPKRIQSLLLIFSFTWISCFMIIMLYLFIPVLTYLLPEYFLFGINCTLVLILLRHLALYHTRLGSFTDSPGFSCPGHGARSA